MPIVKASQQLDDDLSLVLKQIVDKIHVDKKLLADPLFFEEIFKHQFIESSNFKDFISFCLNCQLKNECDSKESDISEEIIWLSDAELPQKPKKSRNAFYDDLEKEKITNCHLRAEIVQLKQEKEQIKEKLNEEVINSNDLKSQFNFLHDNYLQANTLIKNREATISNQRETIEELNQLRQKLESVIENLNDKYDLISKEHANLTNQLFNLTKLQQQATVSQSTEPNKSSESLVQENGKLVQENQSLRASIKEKQWQSNTRLSSENIKAIHAKANAAYKVKIERYSQNNLRHMEFLKKKSKLWS